MPDWGEIARREEERSATAQGDVLRANGAYGAGLAHLMLGDRSAAGEWLDRAVQAYRESWADAAPDAWGRPIAALKARLIAGEPAEEEAHWALDAGAAESDSPIGGYAAALANLVLGEYAEARVHADRIRRHEGFPGDVGDALAMIAAGTDFVGYVEAIESVLESFETREEYLEDVPVADTVLALQALARQRELHTELTSPLLPENS